MGRGRLDPPKLDDRNWQEIRDQALKLISQKCPAWTDRSPSDPGIAIVEMFAWLVEGMIWRLDQVPERNFVEFLNLLGITRDPPVPAMNWLTFTNSTPTTKVVVPEGTQAGTLESSSQTATIFETDESVEVFPGEIAQAWAVQDDSRRPREANDVVKQIVKSPLQGWDVVLSLDGPGEAKESVVSLGLTQVPPANESFSIHVQIANLEGEPDVMPREQFELSVDTQYSGPNASRKSFIPQQDQTNNLLQSGRIVWKSPADWTAVKRSVLNQESPPQSPDLPLFWLDFRLKVTSHVSGGVGSSSRQPKIRLGHMLYNSVAATNALTYRKPANSLPDLVSDGRPFQFLELAYRPLYKRPGSEFPYEHVVVKVSLPGETREQATKWSVVSELAYGDNPCVQVDPVAGTLEFGDGIRGKIPPSGGQIWVESYRYVAGGSVGNVGSGSVRLLQRPIDGINAVTNPGPGRSGVDEEEIEQTKVRAPQALKNRDRAVTTADFEYLAREASNRVQKVRCLPPASTGSSNPQVPITSGRLNRSEGHLNVLIVSNSPGAIPPLEWDLIREVQDHLDARRMITTRLHVASPRFVPIRVDVRYRLFPPPPGGVVRTATFAGNLENALREAMNAYLHPLTGRPSQVGSNDGQGWEIGQSLFAFELFDHLKSVLGRDGYLTQMKLFRVFPGEVDETLFGQFKLTPDDGVSLADFEMICAADPSLHVIQPGDSL